MNHIAILIHGCHLQAEEWEHIVFGTQDRLGRVPTAIEEAVNRKAALIFWGTGASEFQGLKESEYTFQKTLGPKLQDLAQRVKKDPQELSEYLQRVSFIDKHTQNTAEEIASAMHMCQSKGIQELILISSPTHIARCLQEACKFKEKNKECSVKFYAHASETCFAYSTAADVTIVEPPHRCDRPQVPFHQTVRGIFQFLGNEDIAFAFNEALKNLIEEYQKKLQNM